MVMEPFSVGRADASAFLASVLESVQAVITQMGSFGMSVHPEDAAFFLQFIEQVFAIDALIVKVPGP
jgi:hypothetical protein